jgi:xanthine dehydrogenase small subunit
MICFILNRDDIETELPAGMVMLDFLRRQRGLTGTKEGCREGDCGACMILLGEPRNGEVFYRPVNSCLLPLGDAAGRHVVTIEGLNSEALTPVQQAFVEENATQCGFCTPGFIVSLAGFLLSSPRWDVDTGVDAVDGNICRCTGYVSIRRAVERICSTLGEMPARRLPRLVEQGWIPAYFLDVPGRLRGDAAPSSGVPVAGGTDLFVQRPEELAHANLNLMSRREDLRGIRVENSRCVIGAATPWADLEDSPVFQKLFPGIADHFKLIASRPIRHRATIGGNIVNASPIGDLTILLLALDASVVLADREIPLRDFYLGYKKLNKRPDELVLRVAFPVPGKDALLNFEKVCRRTHLDIASVNSAMLAIVQEGRVVSAHISAGGVAPIPLYLARTVEALKTAGMRAALDVAQTEVSPISDVRGSADYKRLLLRQLLITHFLKLAPEREKELLP